MFHFPLVWWCWPLCLPEWPQVFWSDFAVYSSLSPKFWNGQQVQFLLATSSPAIFKPLQVWFQDKWFEPHVTDNAEFELMGKRFLQGHVWWTNLLVWMASVVPPWFDGGTVQLYPESNLTRSVFHWTANFGSSLHPPQTDWTIKSEPPLYEVEILCWGSQFCLIGCTPTANLRWVLGQSNTPQCRPTRIQHKWRFHASQPKHNLQHHPIKPQSQPGPHPDVASSIRMPNRWSRMRTEVEYPSINCWSLPLHLFALKSIPVKHARFVQLSEIIWRKSRPSLMHHCAVWHAPSQIPVVPHSILNRQPVTHRGQDAAQLRYFPCLRTSLNSQGSVQWWSFWNKRLVMSTTRNFNTKRLEDLKLLYVWLWKDLHGLFVAWHPFLSQGSVLDRVTPRTPWGPPWSPSLAFTWVPPGSPSHGSHSLSLWVPLTTSSWVPAPPDPLPGARLVPPGSPSGPRWVGASLPLGGREDAQPALSPGHVLTLNLHYRPDTSWIIDGIFPAALFSNPHNTTLEGKFSSALDSVSHNWLSNWHNQVICLACPELRLWGWGWPNDQPKRVENGKQHKYNACNSHVVGRRSLSPWSAVFLGATPAGFRVQVRAPAGVRASWLWQLPLSIFNPALSTLCRFQSKDCSLCWALVVFFT